MKHLYFDIFASFSPVMAASSVVDMLKSEDEFKAFSLLFGGYDSDIKEVRRQSMEATLVTFCPFEEKTFKYGELISLCEGLSLSQGVKDKLCLFIKILSEAKAFDVQDAEFKANEILPNLISSAYVFKKTEELDTQKVYVPRVFTRETLPMLEMSECEYIVKKYGIKTECTGIDVPLFSKYGAAFLSVCRPEFSLPPSPLPIKIGYGAGEDDIKEVPNILRTVYGESDEEEKLFMGGAEFEEIFHAVEA